MTDPMTMHWNGSAWTEEVLTLVKGQPGNPPGGFDAIAAVSPHDVWAVGVNAGEPLAEHWNGRAWTVVPTPSPVPRAVRRRRALRHRRGVSPGYLGGRRDQRRRDLDHPLGRHRLDPGAQPQSRRHSAQLNGVAVASRPAPGPSAATTTPSLTCRSR